MREQSKISCFLSGGNPEDLVLTINELTTKPVISEISV